MKILKFFCLLLILGAGSLLLDASTEAASSGRVEAGPPDNRVILEYTISGGKVDPGNSSKSGNQHIIRGTVKEGETITVSVKGTTNNKDSSTGTSQAWDSVIRMQVINGSLQTVNHEKYFPPTGSHTFNTADVVSSGASYYVAATVSSRSNVGGAAGGDTAYLTINLKIEKPDSSSSLQPPNEQPLTGTDTIPVSNVIIENCPVSLGRGQQITLRARVVPVNATDQRVFWKLNPADSPYASIDRENGLLRVTGDDHPEGRITVTAYSAENNNILQRCFINIETPVSRIYFNPQALTLTPRTDIGEANAEVVLVVEPVNAGNKRVTFTSNLPNLVRVTPLGPDGTGNPRALITALVPNQSVQAVITARAESGGHTARLPVDVIFVPVRQIVMIPAALSLMEGNHGAVQYKISPENATDQRVQWISNNPRVADVQALPGIAHGMVKGFAPGETVISVITIDGNFSAATSVKVVEKQAGYTDDSIDPAALEKMNQDALAAQSQAAQLVAVNVQMPDPASLSQTTMDQLLIFVGQVKSGIPGPGTLQNLIEMLNQRSLDYFYTFNSNAADTLAGIFGPTLSIISNYIEQVLNTPPREMTTDEWCADANRYVQELKAMINSAQQAMEEDKLYVLRHYSQGSPEEKALNERFKAFREAQSQRWDELRKVEAQIRANCK